MEYAQLLEDEDILVKSAAVEEFIELCRFFERDGGGCPAFN